MKPARFDYYEPTTLGEALSLLAQLGDTAKVLAGGQSLVPMMNMRLARPAQLVDLNRLDELDYLKVENGELRIGAMTRQRALERSEVVAAGWPLLQEATRHIGHVQILVPIARTLGNCLSAANLARLVDLIGPARAKDLLFTGRLIDADEALALGVATRVVPADRLDAEVMALSNELRGRAVSTIEATKAVLQRIREHRRPAPADDIVAKCYGSAEFREGVAAFLEGRKPTWSQ